MGNRVESLHAAHGPLDEIVLADVELRSGHAQEVVDAVGARGAHACAKNARAE